MRSGYGGIQFPAGEGCDLGSDHRKTPIFPCGPCHDHGFASAGGGLVPLQREREGGTIDENISLRRLETKSIPSG